MQNGSLDLGWRRLHLDDLSHTTRCEHPSEVQGIGSDKLPRSEYSFKMQDVDLDRLPHDADCISVGTSSLPVSLTLQHKLLYGTMAKTEVALRLLAYFCAATMQ